MLEGNEARATDKDLWTLNSLVTILATAEDTEGSLGAVVQHLTPAGNVPLHQHSREDEAFYILEGRLTFDVGGSSRTVGPGDFLFAPRGIPHRFTVDSDEARMVVLMTPGGFENFFADTGRPADSPTLPTPEPPDLGQLGAAAARYGVDLLGPPA